MTPLHWASCCGHIDIVKELLNQGADKEAKSKDGWTPLFVAAWYGKTDISKELLAHGANLEASQNDGKTPLHIAFYHGNIEVANELLAHNANLGARANDRHTPIDILLDPFLAPLPKLKAMLDNMDKSTSQDKFQSYRILNEIEKKLLNTNVKGITLEEVKAYKEKIGHDCYKGIIEENKKLLGTHLFGQEDTKQLLALVLKFFKQMTINYKQIVEERFVKTEEELKKFNINFEEIYNSSPIVHELLKAKSNVQMNLFPHMKLCKGANNSDIGYFKVLPKEIILEIFKYLPTEKTTNEHPELLQGKAWNTIKNIEKVIACLPSSLEDMKESTTIDILGQDSVIA